jgi:L-cysteine:1D-myo-inositol 2-amino-2-deoxy-alpha-D-glucopyranoside ligase
VTGKTFCRHWFHVGMVGLDGTKMSKSLGNLVFVGDLLKEWEPMAIRLALLEHHYRADWEWQDASLERAAERLERWRAAGDGDAGIEQVRRALDDDLDAPGALAVVDGWADEALAAGGAGGAGAPAAPRAEPASGAGELVRDTVDALLGVVL